MTRVWLVASALLLSAAATARAASVFDPALRFRTIATAHFIIYFHQGEDRLAHRLAAIAEDTWTALGQPFGAVLPPRTHVVLVDQSEAANGYATPLPYNTVVVTTAWPAGSDFIGNTDDWLRLVFTHEFTHIVHLDRSEGWARVGRRLFGRMAFLFPNLYLPAWQIEGLATYEESVVTGSGRLHAGDFGAVIREDARQAALLPLDRVNGGLTDWPSGLAPYAYGLGFHQYLADRFGAASLGDLAAATAGRVPYTTSRMFKRVFGESLGALWRQYEASTRTATPLAEGVAPTRLTYTGFIVSGPRFDRFDRESPRPSIVYALQSPDDFPAMYRLDANGASRRLTTRYFGTTVGVGRDALFFDQQEIHRNVAAYSDVYRLSRADGSVTRLTSESRLLEPDLSPDERALACVRENRGQRDLVVVTLHPALEIRVLAGEPETQFNAPRWSPDGRAIAVERHRLGHLSEIVVVDIATGAVRVAASATGTRFVTPAWRPDGGAIVTAAAAEDEPFNLYEFSVANGPPPRQLTRTTGGATWPDVSPDGRTLLFVGYTSDGFDVFSVAYDQGLTPMLQNQAVFEPTGSDPAAAPDRGPTPSTQSSGSDPVPYSPWPTLLPASWSPIIESDADQVRVGAAVAGYDVLRYHSYGASATWLTSGPSDAPKPNAAAPDWRVFYAYDRWQPTLYALAESSTSFFAGPANAAGAPTPATLRERNVEAGVLMPFRSARVTHRALFSMVRAADDFLFPTRTVARNRTAGRAAFSTTTAHTYGYSISPEGGVAAGGTIEAVRRSLGSSADATTVTGDARTYLRGAAPHHVVALRLAAGRSIGEPGTARTFRLGGADPNVSVTSFDQSAISLLRGFPANSFAGSHVALLNAEYRLPLVRPQRGSGTWPVFLHTVHAAAFVDAGHAWTAEFRTAAMKTSVGAELSANVVAGYFFPFTATIGAARGHDGSGSLADRTTVYVRIGHAF
jgi:WD40 repeat protein